MNFAIDLTTYNMVVAGESSTALPLPLAPQLFLYYVEESSCSVRWHFNFEKGLRLLDWDALAIRDEENRIYATAKGLTISLIVIDTSYMSSGVPIELNFFSLPQPSL